MSENVGMSPKRRISGFLEKHRMSVFFQKYTMTIALVVVTIVFAMWKGKEGLILLPSNVTALIAENAYVFLLAAGMLLCILTGGNIDLSVGSVVCFTAAIGCTMMADGVNMWLAVLVMLYLAFICGAGYILWALLMKNNPVSRIAIFGFVNPVANVLLSAVLNGEPLFRWQYLAALVFVCVGIWLVNKAPAQKEKV